VSGHNDATFLRMFLLILGALVAFTVIIMFMANIIGGSMDEIKAGDTARLAAVEKRIAPVGRVNIAGAEQTAGTPAAAPAASRSGAEVYQAVCFACHFTGAADAPKLGDKAAWDARAATGMDSLVSAAINGKGAMPPRGGNPATTDQEIRAAVVHMLTEMGYDTNASAAAAAPSAVEQAKETAGAVVETAQTTAPNAVEQVKAAAADAVAAGQEMVGGAVDKAKEPVAGGTVAAPTGAASSGAEPVEVDLKKGQQVYQVACFACHGTGAAGAPKLGDAAAWAPRIAQGSEMLLKSALSGKGAMPPKGGRVDISDMDITAAVAYLIKESQ